MALPAAVQNNFLSDLTPVVMLAVLILLACLTLLLQTYQIWSSRRARREEKIPAPGKATMYDVRRLLLKGEKDRAIRIYRGIFGVAAQKAREDIEELERSLKT